MEKQDTMMDTIAAADYMALRPSCLQQWRFRNKGPKYVRVGNQIRYRKSDLDDFMVVVEPENK